MHNDIFKKEVKINFIDFWPNLNKTNNYFYNLIFVFPLILIAFIAIKTQSITAISAFMRERLNLIKLFSALVFLAIFIYYLFFVILPN